MAEFKKPPPLEIKCTSSDCENGLHCFKAHRRMALRVRGTCRSCGADLVDWRRLHRRDARDAAYTFTALQHELIRHHHFHKTIDEGAVRHARRKGRSLLREAARTRLAKHLAPAEPVRDGYQTPLKGNAVYYAQHATACCCRTCLEYWHGIPKGRALTEDEFEYCATLVDLYLRQRLPDLKEDPEKVPRRRAAAPEPEARHPS